MGEGGGSANAAALLENALKCPETGFTVVSFVVTRGSSPKALKVGSSNISNDAKDWLCGCAKVSCVTVPDPPPKLSSQSGIGAGGGASVEAGGGEISPPTEEMGVFFFPFFGGGLLTLPPPDVLPSTGGISSPVCMRDCSLNLNESKSAKSDISCCFCFCCFCFCLAAPDWRGKGGIEMLAAVAQSSLLLSEVGLGLDINREFFDVFLPPNEEPLLRRRQNK